VTVAWVLLGIALILTGIAATRPRYPTLVRLGAMYASIGAVVTALISLIH
jgi:hypothetical protein